MTWVGSYSTSVKPVKLKKIHSKEIIEKSEEDVVFVVEFAPQMTQSWEQRLLTIKIEKLDEYENYMGGSTLKGTLQIVPAKQYRDICKAYGKCTCHTCNR